MPALICMACPGLKPATFLEIFQGPEGPLLPPVARWDDFNVPSEMGQGHAENKIG